MIIWKENKEKEVTLSQNGRFLEFYKRHSPYMYKYDMGSHEFFCEKRSNGEHHHHNNTETNRWFNAKLITEDNKLANMFTYARALAANNAGILGIMEKFNCIEMQRFEKWAALGTNFSRKEHAWGNRRTIGFLTVEPNDVDRDIRRFISEKTWSIAELNNFCHIFDSFTQNENNIVNKIFAEIADHPEYSSAFIVISNGRATNYLQDSNILRQLTDLISTYNLGVPRLMFYINYLNEVERISVYDLLQTYDTYLHDELVHRNGRRNKMFKFPNNYMTTFHIQQEVKRRESELENYSPEEHIYDNEYLEYEDNDFKIIIPRGPEDVRDEGRQMHHCIARSYMNHIADGDTVVVFMRRTADPDTSFITIEIRNNVMRQACTAHNNRVPEEYKPWIRNWARMKGVTINDNSWRTTLVY